APPFQDALSSEPSRLSSPLASLCFWSKLTRSSRVKPSCAVTKLTLAEGGRRVVSYRSALPAKRGAISECSPMSPFQNLRTVSRSLPSPPTHPKGKFPPWYPPSPKSQGSAINFTGAKVG